MPPFTLLNRLPIPASRLMALLGLMTTSWLLNSAQAQSFTFTQIEAGTGCDWPFNAVATNPVDGKAYGFWQKGLGRAANVASGFGASDDVGLNIFKILL